MRGRGLKPRKYRDARRYSYHQTFEHLIKQKLGAVGGKIPDFLLPAYTNSNQNKEDKYWSNPPLPSGCTGFAFAGVAEADLKAPVDPRFTYDKTLLIANGAEGDFCTLEDAAKSGTVYGVRLKGENDDQALIHRRSPYFEVHPQLGQDWFDALASAAYTNQRPVVIGTTWPMFFETVKKDGIQNYTPKSWVGGHAHNIVGKKTIGGVEYLIDKSWNGPEWGDGGYSYFSRETINATMKVSGSDALTNRPAAPGDIKVVQLNILQLLISLYYRLLASLTKPVEAPKLPPEPVSEPLPVIPPPMNPDVLLPWNTKSPLSHENWHNVRAICDLEGLTHDQKEILTACVWRESDFMTNPKPNQNKDKTGKVWSTDWGIVQVNDYWNIGPGKPFPSVQYVLDNPEACVRYMAKYYKQHGNLGVKSSGWASFTSGDYKQFLGKTL